MSSGILLVTGGAHGIGAEICKLAAKRGYDVAIGYRQDHDAARAVADECQGHNVRAVTVACDLAMPENAQKLFEHVDQKVGTLTAFVNNAGTIGRSSRLDQADPAMIRDTIDLNVTASILCAREAIRRMSTANGGKGGNIVNISSVAARLGSAGEFVWYAASKGAIDSLTIGLAREVAKEGIRVNAVAPGLIETRIHAQAEDSTRIERLVSSVPMQRIGLPQEVAEAVLYLLSEQASYVTGTILNVSGGR